MACDPGREQARLMTHMLSSRSRYVARTHPSGKPDSGIERLRDERFHPRRAAHPQPERPAMRLEGDLEMEEGTATALGRDELQQRLQRALSSGKSIGIAIW